jgi:hypothetical protein
MDFAQRGHRIDVVAQVDAKLVARFVDRAPRAAIGLALVLLAGGPMCQTLALLDTYTSVASSAPRTAVTAASCHAALSSRSTAILADPADRVHRGRPGPQQLGL